jgi:cyclophilin family peptidyl-prolyl cis-trans isomerase
MKAFFSSWRRAAFVLALIAVVIPVQAQPSSNKGNPMIRMTTNQGSIDIELFEKEAPATTANFLQYVKDGFFDGLIFHRVIPGFMVQGGGFAPGMKQKPTRATIQNEADNGLKNKRGTLAMARTSDPHSASAQFFINVVDNSFLDFTAKNDRGWGYAVFGRVAAGMEVMDKIVKTPTANVGGHGDVPVQDVVIQSCRVITP